MRIAIIGCGNMGAAFARRLSKSHDLFLFDHAAEKAKKLAREKYGQAVDSMGQAIHKADAVILAIKPQNLEEAALAIKKELKKGQILISMLGGVPLLVLKKYFPANPVVRIMPNLGVLMGKGAIGVAVEEPLNDKVKKELIKLFEELGKVYWIPEGKMDAFTSLAGSGPAFIFVLIEAMVESGIAMGFTSDEATEIVYQMLHSSLGLLEYTHKHPAELKWQVTSPGGTTIAGLQKMEQFAVRNGVMQTFLAAYEKSKQFASTSGN